MLRRAERKHTREHLRHQPLMPVRPVRRDRHDIRALHRVSHDAKRIGIEMRHRQKLPFRRFRDHHPVVRAFIRVIVVDKVLRIIEGLLIERPRGALRAEIAFGKHPDHRFLRIPCHIRRFPSQTGPSAPSRTPSRWSAVPCTFWRSRWGCSSPSPGGGPAARDHPPG